MDITRRSNHSYTVGYAVSYTHLKLNVIENLLNKADTLIIGGGMAYTFLAAKGYGTGTSLLDEEKIDYCKNMLAKAEEKGVQILLPIDCTIADAVSYTHLLLVPSQPPYC